MLGTVQQPTLEPLSTQAKLNLSLNQANRYCPVSRITQIYPAYREPGNHCRFSGAKNTFKSQGESGLPDKDFQEAVMRAFSLGP